jgi:hypothetical protein
MAKSSMRSAFAKNIFFLFLVSPVLLFAESTDTDALIRYRQGAQGTVSHFSAKNNLSEIPTQIEREELVQAWEVFLDYMQSLDVIRVRHSQKKDKQSIALSYAAFLAGYRSGLEWIDQAEKNPTMSVILNEATQVRHMGYSYDSFKFRFLNVAMATQFFAYQAVYAVSPTTGPLSAVIPEDEAAIWKMGIGRGQELTFKNGLRILTRTAGTAWFPVQKNVAEWMGDTRVHRGAEFLITQEQIEVLRPRLQPGDIFLNAVIGMQVLNQNDQGPLLRFPVSPLPRFGVVVVRHSP